MVSSSNSLCSRLSRSDGPSRSVKPPQTSLSISTLSLVSQPQSADSIRPKISHTRRGCKLRSSGIRGMLLVLLLATLAERVQLPVWKQDARRSSGGGERCGSGGWIISRRYVWS